MSVRPVARSNAVATAAAGELADSYWVDVPPGVLQASAVAWLPLSAAMQPPHFECDAHGSRRRGPWCLKPLPFLTSHSYGESLKRPRMAVRIDSAALV